jgi:GntR family transcriptional regulator
MTTVSRRPVSRGRLPYSPTEPLYARLKVALRQLIAAGMKAGDQLPTEAALCERYGVSRITVREAMQVLEAEGVIVRRQGRGTYVADPRPREPAAYFGSARHGSGAHDLDGVGEIISCEVLEADLRIGGRLDLVPGTPVYRIRSRRLNDGQPVCYQVSYVPQLLLGPVEPDGFEPRSLYARLERALGDTIEEAQEAVDVVEADRYRAQRLGVKLRTPLLLIERVVYSRGGIAVEYSRSFYNPRMVSLTFASRRSAESGQTRRLSLRRADGTDGTDAAFPRAARTATKSRRSAAASRASARNSHD